MNEVEVVGPTPLAAATANAKKWIESHPAGKPVKIPTTLTVRHRKHLVSVPVAQALAQQYERVGRVSNAALREMVIFGAMLDRIDKALSSSRYTRSDNGPGVSLRSWLAENCPGIEYATAMDYKRTTRNYMAYLKLKEDTPLLEMMQADPYDDEKKENLRRQILDTMAHLTKSQLRRLTDVPRGPGRPKGSGAAADGLVRKLSRADEAKAIWNRFLQEAAKRSVKDALPLLGEAETKVAYDALGDLRALLRRHLDEFGG